MKKIAIISIPYAGGNKYSFIKFKPFFCNKFEFVTLELPGRGGRALEDLLSDLHEMVDDLYAQIEPYLANDYIIYGHSMGGMLGNLLIRKLNRQGKKLPLHFFVTGCRSPLNNDSRETLYLLNDADFRLKLTELGGLATEVLHNEELMAYFLPIIREDIKAIELYQYSEDTKYSVPITAIAGTAEDIDAQNLRGWSHETSAELKTYRFPGNHFFILDHFKEIAALIESELDKKAIIA